MTWTLAAQADVAVGGRDTERRLLLRSPPSQLVNSVTTSASCWAWKML